MSSAPPPRRRLIRLLPVAVTAAALALSGSLVPSAGAVPSAAPQAKMATTTAPAKGGCANRTNNTYEKLLDCVTVEGVRAHQQKFQQIADANNDPYYPGSRVAGTKGYADSVAYVADKLRQAGYSVTLDPFEFDFVFPAVLEQLTPTAGSYETGTFTGSGDGDVTGTVIPVDINLNQPGGASTSGCEDSDYDALDFSGPNDIALVQRGTCQFDAKAIRAQAEGAEAVVIFNQGNDPTRQGLIVGTLGTADISIPVVGASYADGVKLAAAGSTAHVKVTPSERRTDFNVIAEKRGTNNDNVVMSGAHLDSVESGPGINDNGSGSAALLETALQMSKVKPVNTVRFAWWGDEEGGLVGSADYVEGLSDAERERIALYMNYDMVGSPNGILMTYDADESQWPAPQGVPIPDGSEAIEKLYESFYTSVGQPYDDAQYSGRSDYQAFIEAGIPSGGLFTGAEGIKTAEQQAIWGGTTGAQYDPCYHSACDTLGNVDLEWLDVNSDLIAFAQLTYAYSTESVNGVAGKPVPESTPLPEPAGPEGTTGP